MPGFPTILMDIGRYSIDRDAIMDRPVELAVVRAADSAQAFANDGHMAAS